MILNLSAYSQNKVKKVAYDDWPITKSSNVKSFEKTGDVTVNFVPIGTVWDRNIITYFCQNGTDDINADDERQAIRDGFALWSIATNLAFLEVCNAADADIVILWGTFNHGDAGPFDGVGGNLAHVLGGPPPNNFGTQAGDIHFDDSETWSLNIQNGFAQPIDLVTVAAHEIGHSLGLDHTQVAGSLMLGSYTGSHRFLGSDDIAGIQSLYGAPNGSIISGSTQFCNTPETYSIPDLPAGATVTWSINPAVGRVNLTTSGNTVTLTRTGNGYVQLSATINGNCGSVNLSPINIFVGIPQITNIVMSTIYDTGFWCAYARGNYFDIELQPGQDPNNYTFELQLVDPITDQVFVSYTVYGGHGTFASYRPPYTNYILKARVIDHPCGPSNSWFGYEMEFTDCSNNYRVSNFNIYPNPASNDLTIEYSIPEDGENLSKLGQQKDVKLYNQKGEVMLSSLWIENEQKLKLDTKNIPNGTYFLHIKEGKETIKKQIIIKH